MDDVVLLSRIQFALTIMFHYLFPPLTIGMGIVLVYLEGQYLRTKDPIFESAAKFWTQLFAITFAVGVATGIVMEFQFGTNWATYSRFVGDVFGSALAAEGVFAFFLESGFLAVLVFGWNKVSPRFHFFATIMVALGSIFSAVWIVVANSWQQTPAGRHIVQRSIEGVLAYRAEVVDFSQVVFNPSTINRLSHTLIGAFIMGAFFIMSISAYYLLRKRHVEFAKRSFTGALIFATLFSVLQLVNGHFNAMMVAERQPAKLAAFEGVFETGSADLSLFGLPDADANTTRMNLAIPGGLSFLIHGDFDTPVTGLDAFPKEDWPPLLISFASYHTMVGIGMFFIALTLFASFLRWRGKLFDKRWLLGVFVGSVVLAMVANQLGWVAAEVGRQPWIVQADYEQQPDGTLAVKQVALVDANGSPVLDETGRPVLVNSGLRTSDSVSEALVQSESGAQQVLGSIIMFGLIYLLLGGIWLFVLNHKIHIGPEPVENLPDRTTGRGVADAAAARVGHTESMSGSKE